MEYTVDYFINKFETIPESKWITGQFNDDHGACCAQGHVGMNGHNCGNAWSFDGSMPEAEALLKLFSAHIELDVCAVNNGYSDQPYQQPTPKQRILAALYDIKKLQQSYIKTVYVTVDAEVRELQAKELCKN